MNAMNQKTFERPISEPVNRRMLTVDQIDDLGEAPAVHVPEGL